MKQIKYHAWHVKEKKMYEVMMIDFIGKRLMLGGFTIKQITKQAVFKDVEMLEFTGLKDKNGKEIFEGDICKWPSGNNTPIEWNEERGCFTANWKGTGLGGGRGGIVPTHIEVIGNIFENPELINKKQDEK